MARKCSVCGKGITVGMRMSHSHIRTKRTWAPNLQRVKAIVNGTPTRILVCTRCLRSGKVHRAV
ncbi:MAG: 50S ribosomal protein L28 [Desulfotomaculaceae bacterium]|nr:50S ribosomal protein L28 [Desulfotomaculaceae bacterium]